MMQSGSHVWSHQLLLCEFVRRAEACRAPQQLATSAWLAGCCQDARVQAAQPGGLRQTSDSNAAWSQGIYAYVTLDEGVETSEELRKELINAVRNEIGAFGEPHMR